MYAAAGVPLGAVVMEAVERGFADIAYAGGIPGSIGGARRDERRLFRTRNQREYN